MQIDYTKILIAYYPTAKWFMNGDSYDGITWISPLPKPTQEELDAYWVPLQEQMSKDKCKATATTLLYETDWATIPDIADSSQTPYLKNQAEFIAWRSQIRQLAVNPIVDPVFPPTPEAVWG